MWVQPSVKCQTGSFQGSLVGRTKWKPSFMWGGVGGTFGLYFCSLWMAPCSSQMSSETSLATLTRNRSCSLYFSRDDYLCTCHEFSLKLCRAPKPSTPPPKNQTEQGWVTTKKKKKKVSGSRDSCFLELWIHHMLCKIILVNLTAEVCLWETLWE